MIVPYGIIKKNNSKLVIYKDLDDLFWIVRGPKVKENNTMSILYAKSLKGDWPKFQNDWILTGVIDL